MFSKILIPDKYIISYKNKQIEKWNLIVRVFAVLNSFMVPAELTFNPKIPGGNFILGLEKKSWTKQIKRKNERKIN